jgi:hypothetical protein
MNRAKVEAESGQVQLPSQPGVGLAQPKIVSRGLVVIKDRYGA